MKFHQQVEGGLLRVNLPSLEGSELIGWLYSNTCHNESATMYREHKERIRLKCIRLRELRCKCKCCSLTSNYLRVCKGDIQICMLNSCTLHFDHHRIHMYYNRLSKYPQEGSAGMLFPCKWRVHLHYKGNRCNPLSIHPLDDSEVRDDTPRKCTIHCDIDHIRKCCSLLPKYPQADTGPCNQNSPLMRWHIVVTIPQERFSINTFLFHSKKSNGSKPPWVHH